MTFRFFSILRAFYLMAAVIALTAASSVHAGLTLQMDVIHDSHAGLYTFAPNLSLNSNGGDSTPITYHQIYSPQTNFTGGVGTGSLNNRDDFTDFNTFLHTVTNGTWHLVMNVGDPSQHIYTFTVSSTLTSNRYAGAFVDSPVDGSTTAAALPNFEWHGPTNSDTLLIYVANADFSLFQYAYPSVLATNATVPPALTNGNYGFYIDYSSNVSTLVTATVPKDVSNNSAPGWTSSAQIDTGNQIGFTVHFIPSISTASGHTNVAHYAFDISTNLDLDSSGNGNDLNNSTFWGPSFSFSSSAEAGGGAVNFVGTSVIDTFGPAYPAWTNALAGSFSVSAWIKTTTVAGSDGDNLEDDGQYVIYADNGGGGAIPVGLTGHKAAFLTTDTNGNNDTLHSIQNVATGSYVHIVSTRDQTTGLKCIYINGSLDNSNYSTLSPLTGTTSVNIGGAIGFSGYTGLLDDVQLYTGVLLAADVTNLYAHPGTTLSNLVGTNLVFIPAGHTNIVHYAFDLSSNIYLDSSTNGNDLGNETFWGPRLTFSSNAEAGAGAVQLYGTSTMDTYDPAYTAWSNTLAGSFTVSVWIKTTTVTGADGDDLDGSSEQDIVYANNDGGGPIPVGLTGHKAAFLTPNTNGNNDTLHSIQNVTTGSYVNIISTRDQATGLKCIYINGSLDSSNHAATGPLTMGTSSVNVGGAIGFDGYTGLLDDVQLYSGALSAADITNIYAHPGTVIPDMIGGAISSQALGMALNTTNLVWTNTGDVSWFAENNISFDGAGAAQSGSLLDDQQSILQTTVNGPGTLTFYWQCRATNDSFDLEFDVDGNYRDDIYGNTPWAQDTINIFGAGPHVLTWNANTFYDSGSSTNDAGWLDQVVFTSATPTPVTLINPVFTNGNLQFSFMSQVNRTNTVQYTISLANPNWQLYNTIIGDGGLKTLNISVSGTTQRFFRVKTE